MSLSCQSPLSILLKKNSALRRRQRQQYNPLKLAGSRLNYFTGYAPRCLIFQHSRHISRYFGKMIRECDGFAGCSVIVKTILLTFFSAYNMVNIFQIRCSPT